MQKKYKSYAALRDKLKRSSIQYPVLKQYASLATLFLDTFIETNGYLASKNYYGSKVEIAGKSYSEWIHELKIAGVVVPYKTEGSKGSDFIRFSAGPLIVEYINAEKTKTREIALVSEVALASEVPSKAEFEELKARMCKVEEAVQDLKEASEPPDTEDKKVRRKVATDRLTKLTLAAN
mgnify:CR=1 FL=1